MPQASEELHAKMQRYFGNAIDDSGPYSFLRTAGYTERAGVFRRPSPEHAVTEKEWDCLGFLCDEWDYAFPTSFGLYDAGQ